jgi:Tol biopolymer transport system component
MMDSAPTSTIVTIGSHLGPYEVLALMGRGGMGEVYRARDSRLGRTVAVKVISPTLSTEENARERFDREAHAISKLSHPNICTLFDVGHHNGIDFLVMEFLDGETLATRLERGPLPQEQVLAYGAQLADALEKAHRQGIIHRDLKPGNVMLTKSGAKLLDFGLARLREPGSGQSSPVIHSAAKTMDARLTLEGRIVGTMEYMAPEQLEGKDVDARTDIFAFGAVLYEMVTGRKAFEGPTQASLIAAIMSSDPTSASRIYEKLDPLLDRLILKCLAKDPDDRWQSAQDLATALRWVADPGFHSGAVGHGGISAAAGRITLPRIVAAVLLATSIALGALLVYQIARAPEQPALFKLSVVPQKQTRASGPLSLSPDGRKLVFVATNRQGQKLLWYRSLDSLETRPLPGTEEGDDPFWSADGRSLAFFTPTKLKKMKIRGGPPQVVAEVSNQKGGAWNRDGDMIIAPTFTGGLYHIPPDGGPAVPLTHPDAARQESSHRWPCFLPDGEHFLYVVLAAQREDCGIYVGSLGDGNLKRKLLSDFSRAEYASPGYLVYVRGNTLMAQPFDSDHLELSGEAFSLGEKAGYDAYTGYGAFSVASDGVLAFGRIEPIPKQLAWYDRSGKSIGTVGEPSDYNEPAFAPDWKRLVVERVDPAPGNNDLWIVELVRGTVSRFTFDPSNEMSAIWSPDGERIIFSANPAGPINIYQRPVAGAGKDELVLDTPYAKYPDDISLDGQWLLFDQVDSKTKFDVWFAPLSGDRKPRPFLQTRFNESHARFSPDGKWVAYSSDESGRAEVYLRRFPPTFEGKWQMSTNGGDQAQWRGDGKELFYVSADRKLMAVPIDAGEIPKAGIPRPLFSIEVVPNTLVDYRNQYLASADGKRFLVTASLTESSSAPMTVIVNWRALLHD